MVEIRHLKLISSIGRWGSLKRAAEELHLTQSALSHQLRQLEDSLGLSLFYRTANQLQFTAAGKAFLESSAGILQQLEDLEVNVKAAGKDQLEGYVHGFSQEETQRLYDQASSISEILHWDSHWEEGTLVLEAGCGVGAQTSIIAPQNPAVEFVAVDLAEQSLVKAKESIQNQGISNVRFRQADITQLPFKDDTFDHVFVCFVLEHLRQPEESLRELRRVLKPSGSITVIEGDHGSTYFYPESTAAMDAVKAQVELQQQNGGNANIGRSLYPLLKQSGFREINVQPRQVYVDESKPLLVEGFIKNTFTAMIKGVADEAISNKIIAAPTMKEGIKGLLRTAETGGTFCYTFFKAIAWK